MPDPSCVHAAWGIVLRMVSTMAWVDDTGVGRMLVVLLLMMVPSCASLCTVIENFLTDTVALGSGNFSLCTVTESFLTDTVALGVWYLLTVHLSVFSHCTAGSTGRH